MASLAYSDYNDSSSINNMENKNKKITRHNTTIKKRVDTSNNENVKNMLKIYNICVNFKKMCELMNRMDLVIKMEDIDKRMLRDIVNVNSLYLS